MAILKGCVWDVEMGRCWPTVGYVVASLLLGPVYVLFDTVIWILRISMSLFSN